MHIQSLVDGYTDKVLFKIKQFLKFLVQCNTNDQRKLGGGIELPCFDGAYSVAGNTNHIGQLHLRYPGCGAL